MKVEDIIEMGILIGSRAWNCNKDETSDYDIVITECDASELHEKYDVKSCSNIERIERSEYEYLVFGNTLVDITRFKMENGTNVNLFEFSDASTFNSFIELNKEIMESKLDLTVRELRVNLFIDLLYEFDITERA